MDKKITYLLPQNKLELSQLKSEISEKNLPNPDDYKEWTNSFIKRQSCMKKIMAKFLK